MSLQLLNKNADNISFDCLEVNARAAMSLKEILKTNLGPNGKLKMLVSGSGGITLTKDGCVLLKNMQIQHPTACLIARSAAAQDDITGDGSTSLVVFIGELMQQSLHLTNDGIHPRVLSEGIEIARKHALSFLEKFATKIENVDDREMLCSIARTSLRTKLSEEVAEHLTEIIVDSVKTIHRKGEPIDLYMIELMAMEHLNSLDSSLVQGIVLDHGFRHPGMKKYSENCFLLTCNVSLEYEKTEVNSQLYFKTAEQRSEMVKAERDHVNEKIRQIIALKEKVCKEKRNGKECTFVVLNQKGIDPQSLDFLQKNGIVALRRAKRRNMERLTKAFGGHAVNSTVGLTPECLGFAEKVTEHTLGEERFTFVEGAKDARSCTILLRGPNGYTLKQLKDAVRDGQRAVKVALERAKVVAGAGAFEAACYLSLKALEESGEAGKAASGIRAFALALLSLPKALASNSGLDSNEVVIKLLSAIRNRGEGVKLEDEKVGLSLEDGSLVSPADEGVWDNYLAKRQLIHLGAVMAENLLVVDEVIRAGKA